MSLSFLLLLLAATTHTTVVHACGGFFCEPNIPVIQSGEAIAFGVTLDEEKTLVEMHIQINYQGPAEQFSWLLPIPVQPGNISIGSELLFLRLFQQTLPNYQFTVNELATTCTQEQIDENDECWAFGGIPPPEAPQADDGDDGQEEEKTVVIEEGSVGPFDYTILEAIDNNPESIRLWLQENNYDEYGPESTNLLNYYVIHDHKFVAIRLNKESETGDIQPLILTYSMPALGSNDINDALVACVPIKLTSVAATPDMPIYVYVLGPNRAQPTNLFEVILDDTTVNWLGCRSSQSCYMSDLRARFRAAVQDVNNHAFYTEFAGDANIMAGNVAITIDVTELNQTTSTIDYLNALTTAGVPTIPIVHNIIAKHILPVPVDDDRGCTSSSSSPSSLFGQPQFCLDILAPETINDPVALTAELKEKVFDPSVSAQEFVDRFDYLTRLYAEMSPEDMTKDPFLSFDTELPNVSNNHTAEGVPVCTDDDGDGKIELALDITVDDGSTVRVPARKFCGSWRRVGNAPLYGSSNNRSSAKALTVHGFGDESAFQIQPFNGTFMEEDIMSATAVMDGRVVSQEVPEYVALPPTGPPTAAPMETRTETPPEASSAALCVKTASLFLAFATCLLIGK